MKNPVDSNKKIFSREAICNNKWHAMCDWIREQSATWLFQFQLPKINVCHTEAMGRGEWLWGGGHAGQTMHRINRGDQAPVQEKCENVKVRKRQL